MDLVCSLDDLPFIGDSDLLTLVQVKVKSARHSPTPEGGQDLLVVTQRLPGLISLCREGNRQQRAVL